MVEILNDGVVSELSLAEYAEEVGASTRTVKRWLADDELPGARKDPAGEWRIPARAVRQVRSAEEKAAARLSKVFEQAAPSGTLVPMPQFEQTALVPVQEHTFEAPEPTLRQELDDMPAFLTIKEASEVLGIPQAQILANPDRFHLEPLGYNGSPRLPQRVVRRIMGI